MAVNWSGIWIPIHKNIVIFTANQYQFSYNQTMTREFVLVKAVDWLDLDPVCLEEDVDHNQHLVDAPKPVSRD